MFDNELPVSYYEEISALHKEHGVFVVRHRETGKICVKKVLSVYNPEVYAALFEHPILHTPRIYALYEEPKRLTVIEEYIPGDSLRDILDIRGYLPERDAALCALMLCRILTDLHSFRPPIIHRDIKPSNVIVAEDGRVVLLDMNAARLANPEKEADTRLLGTPGYAAPEQYGFGSSSKETDIYAVGALLEALVSGSPDGRSPRLRRIIEKCRALSPAGRYHSAAALAKDLARFLHKEHGIKPHLLSPSVSQMGNAFSHHSGGNSSFFTVIPLKTCPVCGKRMSAGESACPECGQIMGNAASWDAGSDAGSPADGDSGKSRPAKQRVLFAAVLAALAFVLAAGVISLSRSPQQDAGPGTASSAENGLYEFPGKENPGKENPPGGIFGSWQGQAGSGLTIYRDGTAVYYHKNEVYSEPGDPWDYSGGELAITLSKLHCTITAEIPAGDFSGLSFRSESKNWTEERFTKLPKENPDFYGSALRSNDKAITVLPDGQMEVSLGGLVFRVPKHYLDYENDLNREENTVILSDLDAEQAYFGALCFRIQDFPDADLLDPDLTFPGWVKDYLYYFFYNVELTDVKEETIAGTRAFTARFTGETNQNFRGTTGISSEGLTAFFCEEGTNKILFVFISQSVGRPIDNMKEMEQILYGAARKES